MKCIITGDAFGFVGHILCLILYVLFRNCTGEKHYLIMKLIEHREKTCA